MKYYYRQIIISVLLILSFFIINCNSISTNDYSHHFKIKNQTNVGLLASISTDIWVKDGDDWVKSIEKTNQTILDFKIVIDTSGVLAGDLMVIVEFPSHVKYANWANPSPKTIEDDGYALSWEWDGTIGSTIINIYFKTQIIDVGDGNVDVSGSIWKPWPPNIDEDSVFIEGIEQLLVDASGPYNGSICNPIQFEGLATGGVPPYSWNWDFGDGSTSNLQNPSYNFETDGEYQVNLTVNDDSGNTQFDLISATINTEHISIIIDDLYEGIVGTSINFSSTVTGGCHPYIWNWDFGDGNTSNLQNPSHIYEVEGSYPLILTISDNQNNTNNSISYVNVYSNTELMVDANGPYEGVVNETIQFSGSVIGGVEPYSWFWDFGDGETSNLQNPLHSFNNTGYYTVTLNVTDNESNFDADITSVSIYSNTELMVDANGPYEGVVNETIQFSGSVIGGVEPYSWFWDFGDGSTSNLKNPEHTYHSDGNYIIYLDVTDNNGMSDSDNTNATISIGNKNSVIFYFDDYNMDEKWTVNPENMANGIIEENDYALTYDSEDVENLISNSYSENYTGEINKVELRAYGKYAFDPGVIILRPVFYNENNGSNNFFNPPKWDPDWSEWFDITGDNNSPECWTWSDIKNLCCDVETIGNNTNFYVYSVELRVTYDFINNNPPTTPKIFGTTRIVKNEEYSYTISSMDPEGGDIYYYVDWGDGDYEKWIGPHNSNEEICLKHTWKNNGSYYIKVKSKDDQNSESNWGSIKVSSSRHKEINNIPIFLERIIEWFSLLEHILQLVFDKIVSF